MKTAEFKYKLEDDVEDTFVLKYPESKLKREAAEYKTEVFKREAFKKDENGKSTAIFEDEVYNLLKEKGIWTDKDDEDLKNITRKLDAKLALLAKGRTKEIDSIAKFREVIFKEVKELRTEQFKLLAKSNQFKDVTVEALSDEAEQDYITCYSLYRDGDVVCKTLDNFYSLPEDFRELAKRELGILTGRIDPNWALQLPENKLLIKQKLMDEKGNYLLNGKRVDADGKLINDKGQNINENDEIVDEDGNHIDENGELIDYNTFE